MINVVNIKMYITQSVGNTINTTGSGRVNFCIESDTNEIIGVSSLLFVTADGVKNINLYSSIGSDIYTSGVNKSLKLIKFSGQTFSSTGNPEIRILISYNIIDLS